MRILRDPIERTVPGHIGTAIRLLRERQGLSQEALGAMCGVHGRTISRHERGISLGIHQGLLEKIARACKSSPDEMWHLAEEYTAKKRGRGKPRQYKIKSVCILTEGG
jgi:transcriptional regulator with XRE-family HTH domain